MTTQVASPTQLHGRWLTLARVIWIALAILAVVSWAATVGPRYDPRSLPCAGENCPETALSPQEAETLKETGLSLEFYAGFQLGNEMLTFAAYTLLGVLIFWRRSDDWMGLFVALMLILLGAVTFTGGFAVLPESYRLLKDLVHSLEALNLAGFLPLFYLFPDGRWVPRWTRGLALLVAAYLAVGSLLTGGYYNLFYGQESALQSGFYLLTFTGLFVGAGAQVYRYLRVSSPAQRQQTKWVVFGFGGIVIGGLVWAFPHLFFPPPPGPARLLSNLAGTAASNLFMLLFPLSLALAILRYRLWDIDILVRRTLVYSILTGLLALTYFGSVIILQNIFTAVTGQQSAVVVVISTLAIAALFAPLRRRVQDFIDRRFYRKKYDAAKVIAEFAGACRDETDLDKLTARLVEVVDETMQPTHLSLWLKTGGKKR